MDEGTIAALSTPPGRGGIAVLRISGEQALDVARKVIENVPAEVRDRYASHSYVSVSGKRVEECVYTLFRSPNSYTGEDVVEISIHSNPHLSELVLKEILKNGAREALPGEFTYRAFLNGKIDLIQAESVNELINANSEYYAEMKFGNLEGRLSAFLTELKKELVEMAVKVESIIEFQEDQSLEKIEFTPELDRATARIEKIVSGYRFSEVLDKGLKVVIAGKANAGKSSLFNALLLEDRSITSPVPGTTRDFIREKIHVKGYPVELTDLAGMNSASEDELEKIGILRSRDVIENAHAAIFMLDGSAPVDQSDRDVFKSIKDKKKIILINKSDILKVGVKESAENEFGENLPQISVLQNSGLEKVYGFIASVIKELGGDRRELSVNRRQKDLLEGISDKLSRIRSMAEDGTEDIVLVAEEIRSAVDGIGQLLGEVTDDDILNRIFSDFCIGK